MITEYIVDFLSSLPSPLVIFIIAMIPFIELRGSIPVAYFLYHMPLVEIALISIAGNMLPVPVILYAFKHVEKFLRKYKFFNKLLDNIYERTRKRAEDKVMRYKEMGIILFVAIPLPMTGAWTGSLIAYLFDLSIKRSILIIFFGVIVASLIVTSLVVIFGFSF